MTIAPWRATCIQMTSETTSFVEGQAAAWAVITRNLDRALDLIDKACSAADKPRMVVLPEFGFQGPPINAAVADWIERSCSPVPGPITARLQEAARRYGIYIAGNQFEAPPEWAGRFFNTCFMIDPRGEVILRYRRINTAQWPSPHDFMDAYVEAVGADGTFPVVKTELGNIGMMACGEIAVPEVARVLMLRGAEVLIHPTNEDDNPAQHAAKVARAAENMMYVVSANVAGAIGFSRDGSVLGGRSQIINFNGRIMAIDPATTDSCSVTALIDVQALRDARNVTAMSNALLRTRFEIYAPYFAEASIYPANQFLQTPMVDGRVELEAVANAALESLRRRGIAN